MEDKKETEINRHVKNAVISLDTATTSEDEAEREKFKNNIIKFYGKVPEFRVAVDSAYLVKKKKFEDQGKTVEYERLMEIGRILGLEKEITFERELTFEKESTTKEKSIKEEESISKKEKSNSVEDFSSCSEEFDKQFGCCNSDKCCLIA